VKRERKVITDTLHANELEYFIYMIFNNNIRLKWKTQIERDDYGFEIERDLGGQWKTLGFIPSYNGQIYEYTDYNLSPGSYKYRLKHLDKEGKYKYHALNEEISIYKPRTYLLSQNFPNPFNKITKILFEIPYEEYVTLKISDMSGREVANIYSGFKRSGIHEIEFKNEDLPSGMYYYEITAGSFSDRKVMTILK
jgi:hypothetical protein